MTSDESFPNSRMDLFLIATPIIRRAFGFDRAHDRYSPEEPD